MEAASSDDRPHRPTGRRHRLLVGAAVVAGVGGGVGAAAGALGVSLSTLTIVAALVLMLLTAYAVLLMRRDYPHRARRGRERRLSARERRA
jgi:uncharacterized membrane protein YfcA